MAKLSVKKRGNGNKVSEQRRGRTEENNEASHLLCCFCFGAMQVSVFVIACGGAPTPTPATTPVAISEAAITAKGEVVPEKFSRVAFTSAAPLPRFRSKEGMQVTRGNTLAILDTSDLQLQSKAAAGCADALAEASPEQGQNTRQRPKK